MPYIVNLDKVCKPLRKTDVTPHGWIGTVCVEYGTVFLNDKDPEESLCFRVKDTAHVWALFYSQIRQYYKGDYVAYFSKRLEEFRLDFLVWIHTPYYWKQPWVKEYYGMFKNRFYDFSEEEQRQFNKKSGQFEQARKGLE